MFYFILILIFILIKLFFFGFSAQNKQSNTTKEKSRKQPTILIGIIRLGFSEIFLRFFRLNLKKTDKNVIDKVDEVIVL